MNSTMITCPHCTKPFEISDAIQHQIEDELQKAKNEQTESLRKEFDVQAEERIAQAVRAAVTKEQLTAKLELDKAKQTIELEAERLRSDVASSEENEKQLRKQLSDLMDELSKANKAKENAEITARKELLDKENLIRQEATQQASENFNTTIREKDETINKLREQLTTAKQVAEQGSQQLQGEVLELDIEKNLRAAFRFDTIEEVKKGERGSDIRQIVNEQSYSNCGLVLWECKNAKTYQANWLEKLKDEIAEEKAHIGVIVFSPANGDGEDYKQLADNVWLVKPRYAVMLATLLREILVKVFIANRNAEGKDVKIELLYNYLTGVEFSNRIRYIIEAYNELEKQLAAEKKQAQKRWAAQEKILKKVTSSLYGMSGDLEGIAGREIIALPELEDGN